MTESTAATVEAPPLAGLRVVSCGAGPVLGLATMILADFGASVRRYGDPAYGGLDEVPSARMWLRGSAPGTDLDGDLRWADVVLLMAANGFPGLTAAAVRAANPQAVCAVFEAAEAGSTLPPYDGVLAAKTGRMQNLTGILPSAQPHFAAVPVAVHASAQNLVSGVLAALYQRRQGYGGQVLRTSLVQGLMPYDQGQSLLEQLRPDRRQPDPAQLMPTLNYHPVQCADGRWLQLGNLLPHLFENFLRVAGIEQVLDWLPEQRERARDLILETMQTRTAAEWMTRFEADGGVAAHPYLLAEETLADPDMTANGHVVERNGVRQLGPLARLTATPARITAEAKAADASRWTPAGSGAEPDRLPLHGVTVLELATIIASPLGASFLADMGARVIKVETLGGDPFRHMGGGIGAARCNQGKESISVDLKTEAGQKIVQALAGQADILIHNFRPGVPERLGIDYDTLAALNGRLVYLSANGYGPLGPGALRPSTHPIPGAAMGGAAYQAGGAPRELLDLPALREWSRRLMRANEVNPDPNTAVVVMTASLLGLLARAVSGRGQQIFVDMFAANAYANFDELLAFPGKAPRPSLGPRLTGPHPLYRLYAARTGWVFLAIRRSAEWELFCELTGFVLAGDPFAAETEVLAEALEALFRGDDADRWEARLSAEGIGCVRADALNTGEFFAGPGAERWTTPVVHRDLGRYRRHRPMVDFAVANEALEAGVRCGVHGPALLAELGYETADIEALFSAGVLYSADREEATVP